MAKKPSVLVLIPVKPSLNPALRDRAAALAARMLPANEDLELTIVMDGRGVPGEAGDARPWSKVARIRNTMLAGVSLDRHEWVMWMDADVVDYPADLAQWLVHGAIHYAENGVCAPTVLIEDVAGSPLAPDTFYDWAAFVYRGKGGVQPSNREHIRGRNIDCTPPYYWPNPVSEPRVGCPGHVEMDCVGTTYVVHRDVYLAGARHEDHPAFTDHWPICAKAWAIGRKVVALPHVVARHAFLPEYGEAFH